MSNDDFKVVTSRRRKKNNDNSVKNLLNRLEVIGSDLDDVVCQTLSVLKKHCCYDDDNGLSRFFQIIIYGIGPFTLCHVSRSQLAFIIRLISVLKDDGTHVLVYDPVLSNTDYEILKTNFGFERIPQNEECRRRVTSCPEKSLFFMPHLDKSLYNNLLWSNWSINMSNVVILGNSFHGMKDRISDRIFRAEYPYIDFVLKENILKETVLPFFDSFDDAFNDLSVMSFKSIDKSLSQAMQSLYSDEAPSYTSQEEVVLLDSRPDDPEETTWRRRKRHKKKKFL